MPPVQIPTFELGLHWHWANVHGDLGMVLRIEGFGNLLGFL